MCLEPALKLHPGISGIYGVSGIKYKELGLLRPEVDYYYDDDED